jgi:peptide/nickel transport system permease protein
MAGPYSYGAGDRAFCQRAGIGCVAIVISVMLALPIGVLTAVWKDTFFDSLGKVVALAGPIPAELLAGHCPDVDFRCALGWLPTSGTWHVVHL